MFRKKVIVSYMSGRLGNQMFQYAFAKAAKIAQGGTGEFVFNFRQIYLDGTEADGFEDSLKYFNVEPYKTEEGKLVLKYCSIWQMVVYSAFVASMKYFHTHFNREGWLSFLWKNGLLYLRYEDQRYPIYEKQFHSAIKRERLICSGFFENPLYFNHIRSFLLEEFTPKAAPIEENKNLYEIIESSNSVCVQVRRGDFLSLEYKNRHYVCDENYFNRAIEVVKQKISNPILIFFSDDIDWVKDHIKTNLYESGNNPAWETLRLMYSCKHFVISNSTFAWWAQYLSRNEKKIVISPDRWFRDELNSCAHLLCDSFIKIPCGT